MTLTSCPGQSHLCRIASGHWSKFKILLLPPSPLQVDVGQPSDLQVMCATLFLSVQVSSFLVSFFLLLRMLPHTFNNIFYSMGSLPFLFLKIFQLILLNASWLECFLCLLTLCHMQRKMGTSLLNLTLLASPKQNTQMCHSFMLPDGIRPSLLKMFHVFSKLPFFYRLRDRFFESNLKLKLAQRLSYAIFKYKLTKRYEIFKVILSKDKSSFLDASKSI